MNLFDLGAVALLVVAVVLGLRSGALPQIGGLAGAVGGGATALFLLPRLEGPLAALEPGTRAIVVLLGLLLAVALGEGIGSGLGRSLARGLGHGVLGSIERVAGGLVGIVQAILLVWLAGGLLAVGPFPRLAALAQGSTVVRTIDAALPPPTAIADDLARLIDASGLPDVFIGLEPPPAPPVDRPDDARTRAIAAAAEGSTLRVSAQTCAVISSGTGFVAAPGYVVTNAHVIAGASTVRVNLGGTAYDATPVLFDPDLDVAVLHAPRLSAPALRFAASDPARGATGAVLGYPGGGALTIVPAAVTARREALGRDIFGRSQVLRPILELHAEIDRGNSGGPLMLEDGTVGGVIFAESRTESEVGYALTSTSVAVRVAPAFGRSSPADTGTCLR